MKRWFRLTGRYSLLQVFLFLGILTLTGCGPGKGTVSGQVTYSGAPLPAGRITFSCQGEGKPLVIADIRDGKYSIDNVPAGLVKVAVETFPPSGPRVIPQGSVETAPPAGKYVPIPDKYKNPDQSGLTYTATSGSQKYDIALTP